jgi:hypothetical protein
MAVAWNPYLACGLKSRWSQACAWHRTEGTSSTLRMKYQYCFPAGTNPVTQRTCSCKECNVDRISTKSEFRAENVVVVIWLFCYWKHPKYGFLQHDHDSSSWRKCQFIVWGLSCNFQRRQLQDQQESSACYWLNQSHHFIRQLSVATYSRFVCCINVAHATDCTLARRWLPVVSDKQQILYFCPVHCDTIMQNKPTKCALFKLIF